MQTLHWDKGKKERDFFKVNVDLYVLRMCNSFSFFWKSIKFVSKSVYETDYELTNSKD